jgi:hypothetical protein
MNPRKCRIVNFGGGQEIALLLTPEHPKRLEALKIDVQPDASTLSCRTLMGQFVVTTILMRLMHCDAPLKEIEEPYIRCPHGQKRGEIVCVTLRDT